MTKQQRDMVILGVVLLALVGAVISTLKSNKAAARPKNVVVEEVTPATTKASAKKKVRTAVDWVDNKRVAGIVAEVAARRDPFRDLHAPPKNYVPTTNTGKTDPPIPPRGDPYGSMQPPAYIPPLVPQETPPALVVKGIVLNRTQGNYALVTVGDQAMTVYEGSPAINAWTVSKITAREVQLSKGKQTLSYRLGGS